MRLAWMLMLGTCLSCTRYEWVPDHLGPECAAYQRPVGRLALEPISGDHAPGTVAGRVLAPPHHPVDGAVVRLHAHSLLSVVTDSAGRFTFTDVPRGSYLLEVRRIGFERTADTVVVPVPSGNRMLAQLIPMQLDGPCGGLGTVRVRKPWWKP